MSDFSNTSQKPVTNEELHEASWKLLMQHYKENNNYQLVKHLIDSFDNFIMCKIDDIIEGFNPIEIVHQYLPQLSEKEGVPMYQYYLYITIHTPILGKPVIYEKDGSTKLLTPADARNRNLTYSNPFTVNVDVKSKTYNPEKDEYITEQKQLNNIPLGRIPIMIGSKYDMFATHRKTSRDECRYDMGGYFIINGNEKVIIPQDRIAENKTYVFTNNKESAYSHVGEIRSVQENRFSVPKTTTIKLSSKPNQYGRFIRVNIHHIRCDVPIFILFRAFGIESDKDILNYIVYDVDNPDNEDMLTELYGSVEEANNVTCQKEAFEYLSKYLNINGYPKEFMNNRVKRIEIMQNILKNECLPHVGNAFHKKAFYLGYMVNKLIRCYKGHLPMDNRDSYLNKRVDTPGVLLANLMRQYYGKVIKDMKNMIQKDIHAGSWKSSNKIINVVNKVNSSKLFRMMIIDNGLKFSLSTGNWGIKNNKVKQGVAQVLNRLSYGSSASHLRRLNTPIDKTAKLIEPRKLHGTQIGVICPSETPEGVPVGIVKNLSVMGSITVSSHSDHVRSILHDLDIQFFDGTNVDIFANNRTKVVVNGDIVGTHENPVQLYTVLKTLKRKGFINIYTSVHWVISRYELWISTEGGRCVRPLYIVDKGNKIRIDRNVFKSIMKGEIVFSDLITGQHLSKMHPDMTEDESMQDNSIIEYLDVEEANTAMIAMGIENLMKSSKQSLHPIQYSHLEIDPSLMMGVMAGSIPFSNHNQAPRNSYQAAMAKQATGIHATNFLRRYDTMSHVINYGQVPLIQTKPSKLVHSDKLPCGINAIVAIATFTGYNQEDSVIMNQSAVERGLFQSTYYRTHKEVYNKNHSTGEEEKSCKPDLKKIIKPKPYNYGKLDNSGFVKENTYVEPGDVYIGKCMPQKQDDVILDKDMSCVLKSNEHGFIDRNCAHDKYFNNVNGEGYNFAKVRIRSDRIPTVGDKFSSRMGQKGTIGIILPQEDMPFTKDGIIPDIIVNPHAIPSRMTIGQLLECIMGKACTYLGTQGDGTPFTFKSQSDSIEVYDVISEALESCGMERNGNEIMYNSMTGEQMKTDIFIGPTYYQRLKHMTQDKIHSRAANGPTVMLTRQSVDGRSRDGGLRLGEMEVECLWAHGVMHFLKERFMDCADNYRVFTCKKCGTISVVNPDKNIYRCNLCKNMHHFSEQRIPYAFKLLLQEIQTMSIGTRFITE